MKKNRFNQNPHGNIQNNGYAGQYGGSQRNNGQNSGSQYNNRPMGISRRETLASAGIDADQYLSRSGNPKDFRFRP